MVSANVHATKTNSLLAGDIILIFLSAIFVGLRFLSRRIAGAGLWWDDYVIAVALPLAWVPPVMNLIGLSELSHSYYPCNKPMLIHLPITATHHGFGQHVEVAPHDAVEKWYLCLYIFENFYAPAIAMVKASILLFYARIFPSQKIWFR